ncbi:DNA topoisomerase IB [Psychromicrobium lacuslunae]|uniref:DNA topoisomerase IB n=1 Tax=Psychromicrobium lacuslunae TaxID=1618207 RepID=UPI000698AB6B|nr:DNA topoisomerase IB [Psychromicrobium lacuslunae]
MKQRLTTADLETPGIQRIKRGRGFEYRDAQRGTLDKATKERIRALVIPPAWREVWISPLATDHIQAVGTDDAERRQYLYHPDYLKQGSRKKFRRARKLGHRINRLRRVLRQELRQGDDDQLRALALAVLLVDYAHIRIGNRAYAKNHGTFGVTTLRCEHLSIQDGTVILDFPGKSGQRWHLKIKDQELAAQLSRLAQGSPRESLIAYQGKEGRTPLSPDEVNKHIKDLAGRRFSAKDFRTWQGTMTAARTLRSADSDDEAAWAKATQQVASVLNNTVAVAASAYIDPGLRKLHRQGSLQSKHRLTDAWLAQALSGH